MPTNFIYSKAETATKIEDSVSKSEHGVRISAKVAQSLQQIVERARKVDALVGEIATASHEQNQGIGQHRPSVTTQLIFCPTGRNSWMSDSDEF